MLLKFIPSPPPLGPTFPLAEKSQAVRFLHSMARLKLFSPSFRCTLWLNVSPGHSEELTNLRQIHLTACSDVLWLQSEMRRLAGSS